MPPEVPYFVIGREGELSTVRVAQGPVEHETTRDAPITAQALLWPLSHTVMDKNSYNILVCTSTGRQFSTRTATFS